MPSISRPIALLLVAPLFVASCPPPVISWSQPFAGSWTWAGATTQAQNLVEAGFNDWRLPTRTELQTALQTGGLTGLAPDMNHSLFWTRDTKGNRAYAVEVTTDSGGNVVPTQSGAVVLIQKSSFVWAVAVRP